MIHFTTGSFYLNQYGQCVYCYCADAVSSSCNFLELETFKRYRQIKTYHMWQKEYQAQNYCEIKLSDKARIILNNELEEHIEQLQHISCSISGKENE